MAKCDCSQHDEVTVRTKDLKKVIEYLFDDEEKNYQEHEKKDRKNHIFHSVRRLKEQLEEQV